MKIDHETEISKIIDRKLIEKCNIKLKIEIYRGILKSNMNRQEA